MPAGRRDTPVRLERSEQVIDGYETVEQWTALGQEWAAVFYGRGEERRTHAMEQGSQAATFQMLANPLTRSLTIKDRINDGASLWDVQGIAFDTPKRGEIEVTATRAA